MLAVVQQLMQQYATTGIAFLNLGKLKRVPGSLRNPGPNPSVAGDLQTYSRGHLCTRSRTDLLQSEAWQSAAADAV